MQGKNESVEQLIKETVEQGFVEAIGDAVSIQNTDFKILYQNQAHKDIIGDHRGEYCYRAYEKKDHVCEGCPVAMTFQGGGVYTKERSAPTDRGTIYVEITSSPLRDKSGKIIAGIEVVRDITYRKRVEKELKKSSFYLDNVSDTLIVINDKKEIIKVNKEFSKLWGYSPEEVLGKSVLRIFPKEEIQKHQNEMEKAVSTKKPRNFETVALTKSGLKVPLSIRGSSIFDKDGKLEGFIGIFRDISERKRMEEKLHAMLITDELTGLYNRRGFFSLVRQQLKMANRMKKGLLLLYTDVDSLKLINDEFGHKEGDLILVKAANLLKEVFRESDIIARIGGDEFVVVSIGVDDTDVEKIEARFEKCLEDYNAKRDHVFRLSMSKGMSYYQQECHYSVEELLVQADKLMYEQKKRKKKS
jgi:diguanylate cyclase (GGDEF)-like protein/PAS domain S-box-containing protein